jgi:hypothetical protein
VIDHGNKESLEVDLDAGEQFGDGSGIHIGWGWWFVVFGRKGRGRHGECFVSMAALGWPCLRLSVSCGRALAH